MKLFVGPFVFIFITPSCHDKAQSTSLSSQRDSPIHCTDSFCHGIYIGPEFINRSDVAHQFSNTMSRVVGDKLKELYDEKKYSQVDFERIVMTTKGMGSGHVEYDLKIPFKHVAARCDSYTSFDHVGGWNHPPALRQRKKALQTALLEGEVLDISDLKKTKEGLQEYWIQWRNKDKQRDCTD